MEFISNILGTLFKFIYETFHSIGLGSENISAFAYSIIAMGLVYKLITLPMTIQQAKTQKKQAELQPQLEELKQKYGYNQEVYQQKMMEFQKENNMMGGVGSGCLTFILQMVVILALYNVIKEPAKYLFAGNEEAYKEIAKNFFWIKDLSLADPTGWALPIINSISQLGFQYLSQNKVQQQTPGMGSMQTMMYIMPVMFFFIFRTLPAALVLYWTIGNIIEILIKGGTKLLNRNKV